MTDEAAATPAESATEDNPWGEFGGPTADDVMSVEVTRVARADYKYTLSLTPDRAPSLTVRAESAAELNQAFTELEMSGTWAQIAAHHQTAKAHGLVATQLGGTPVQQPPQGPQSMAQQTFQGMAASQPQWGAPLGAGGQPGTAPAAWQNAGAPAQQGWGGGAPQQQGSQQGPKPRPAWPVVFKINVPFAAKDQFKAFRDQYKDQLRGKVAWSGGGDYWIHGDVVGGFQQYNPQQA